MYEEALYGEFYCSLASVVRQLIVLRMKSDEIIWRSFLMFHHPEIYSVSWQLHGWLVAGIARKLTPSVMPCAGLFHQRKCPKGRHCNFLHVFRNPGNEFRDADLDIYRLVSSSTRERRQSPTPSHDWTPDCRTRSQYSHRSGRDDESVRSKTARSRSRSRSRRYRRSRSSSRHRRRSSSLRRSQSRSPNGRRRSSRSPERRRRRRRSADRSQSRVSPHTESSRHARRRRRSPGLGSSDGAVSQATIDDRVERQSPSDGEDVRDDDRRTYNGHAGAAVVNSLWDQHQSVLNEGQETHDSEGATADVADDETFESVHNSVSRDGVASDGDDSEQTSGAIVRQTNGEDGDSGKKLVLIIAHFPRFSCIIHW